MPIVGGRHRAGRPAEQIAAGADAQNWDPSVKALTAFPQVLGEMDRNMRWTTDLGTAYYNQPQDILQAVQEMRQRAQAAGNLQSTPQETVNYDQGNIEVAPANPQVVYVPAYNPWVVYGQPISPYPGFSLLGALGSFFGSSPVSFGLGILMTAFNRTPFGFIGWGLSWLAQAVLFHQSSYFSHSTTVADWGFAHGGRRAFAANGYNHGYGQPRGGYNSAYGQGFAGRSPQGYSGMRPGEGFNRGYQAPGVGYARPTQQAYNRMQPALNTTQYGRAGYGSSFYGGRPGTSYNVAQQAYRPPAAGFQRNDFAQRPPSSFGGKSFAGYSGKPANSGGGFHPFGGGHSEKSFGGGGKASVAATPAEAAVITCSASITRHLVLHTSSHGWRGVSSRNAAFRCQSTFSGNSFPTRAIENQPPPSILQIDGTKRSFAISRIPPHAPVAAMATLCASTTSPADAAPGVLLPFHCGAMPGTCSTG